MGAGSRGTRDGKEDREWAGIGTWLAYILARVPRKVNQGSGPRGSGMPGDSLGQLLQWWFIRLETLFAQCPQRRGEENTG